MVKKIVTEEQYKEPTAYVTRTRSNIAFEARDGKQFKTEFEAARHETYLDKLDRLDNFIHLEDDEERIWYFASSKERLTKLLDAANNVFSGFSKYDKNAFVAPVWLHFDLHEGDRDYTFIDEMKKETLERFLNVFKALE